MRVILVVVAALLVAVTQVSIAPLFPVAAATFDLALVTLALFIVFAGPRPAMAMLPITAIFLGFATDRSPALLLVGYLPLLPLAAFLGGLGTPVNRYVQLLAAGALTGLFARLLLGVAAVAHGAAFPVGMVVFDLLLPGALLDVALLTALYFPFRFVGWEPHHMSLRRGGFIA